MLRSLTSAVSGLKNFTAMLDSIGNNLANIRTLGFKGTRITFAEAASQSLSGVSRGFGGGFGNQKQIGLGVNISSTDIDFSQGTLEFTGTPTDMAIQGNSFFVLSDGEKNRYSRAGNFFFNNQGILVNPNGLAVQGWTADTDGLIDVFQPTAELFLDTNLSSPAAETTTAFLSGNLDAGLIPKANVLASAIALTIRSSGGPAVAGTALNDLAQTSLSTPLTGGEIITLTGSLADGTPVSVDYTYTAGDTLQDLLDVMNTAYSGSATATMVNGAITLIDDTPGDSSTSLKFTTVASISLPAFEATTKGFTGQVVTSTAVYDSLGAAHNLILTFTKQPADGEWNWEARLLDIEEITAGRTGSITFNTAGEVIAFGTDGAATGITIDPKNGAAAFNVTLDVQGGTGFSGVTSFSSDATLIVRDTDGRPTGSLLRFAIDTQGIITGIFSNEEQLTLAQIALAEFPNPVGLLRSGDGLFDIASSSGNPIIGKAGEQFASTIVSGSLEAANVDLVGQFTLMITTQRGFQANARVVTTADQILEETMRLKR